MFSSVKEPISWYIGDQPLYCHKMILSTVIRAQEGIPRSRSGCPTTIPAWNGQKTPKSSPKCHVLLCQGSWQLLYYISNQPLYFQQITLSKVIRAQKGIPTSQSGSRPQKWPELAKKRPRSPQNVTFCSGRGPTQGWNPRSQSGSSATNAAAKTLTFTLSRPPWLKHKWKCFSLNK